MHNYKSTLKNEDLKNKFLQTQLQLKEQELKFLKTQIHPHFLFNTLNTLYGFALKKSDSAPDMILKLSNLLDYILYQVDKPSVLLTNEIQHIDNYIVLEKMRFQDSLDILFTKELNQKKIEIPPMLLLPFVENAFKHGIQIDGVLKIKATLTTTSNFIEFNIQNTSKETSNSKKGIGLENIKKRLEMLFKRHYSLKITQQNNNFEVNLKIPLNHV
ncbi:histidine kinase [uncultured Tenacibaculum sp.]|uniref:sensor histidine kinase n=1 Tax=uncultured Tenacibaculum sp. TaxID=174713 RepID=UPI0026297932|nr:histidine kinase [uncultured Tenacibaculum sp.]